MARWESLHFNECGAPTLLRFRGRPDELSPLARLSSWLGGPLPFDRHDWCALEQRGGCVPAHVPAEGWASQYS